MSWNFRLDCQIKFLFFPELKMTLKFLKLDLWKPLKGCIENVSACHKLFYLFLYISHQFEIHLKCV